MIGSFGNLGDYWVGKGVREALPMHYVRGYPAKGIGPSGPAGGTVAGFGGFDYGCSGCAALGRCGCMGCAAKGECGAYAGFVAYGEWGADAAKKCARAQAKYEKKAAKWAAKGKTAKKAAKLAKLKAKMNSWCKSAAAESPQTAFESAYQAGAPEATALEAAVAQAAAGAVPAAGVSMTPILLIGGLGLAAVVVFMLMSRGGHGAAVPARAAA